MAKSQASSTWHPRDNPFESTESLALLTWDPWDEPSEKAQAQHKPTLFAPHFLRSKNGETSDKKGWKEKKQQRHLEHKWAQNNSGSFPTTKANAPNVASPACKDLSHITYFNCDKKGHYMTKCPEPRKDRDVSED